MRGTHRRRTLPSVGVAGAGLLLGHWLAYALDAPQTHARDELLRATGHGYLPFATQIAVLAGALGLAALFAARWTHRSAPRSYIRDATVLAAVQCGAFVAMEVAERLVAGASLHDLSHGPLLAIGLVVQLAVALAGAAFVQLTERAADVAELRSQISAPPVPAFATAPPSPGSLLPRRPAMRSFTSRAPPSLP